MFFFKQKFWKKLAKGIELFLAAITFVAVCLYIVRSVGVLIELDWSQTETLQIFIKRMLDAIIGIELMRMLLYHSIGSVLELLAFIIARKMLYPDLTSIDLLLNTGAFILLMTARRFLMEKKFYIEDKPVESSHH